jgi:lactate permease
MIDRAVLTDEDLKVESSVSIWKAISPWLILTAAALIVNAPFLPFYDWLFTRLAMPVELIPGAPEKTRVLWQAYFWVLVSSALAIPFLKPTKAQLKTTYQNWLKRSPRPFLAAAVFFAIAYVINHSGKGLDWQLADASRNMVAVVAEAATSTFGRFYPFVTPYLGLLAGFISGSEASAIAMLTRLHLSSAEKIGAIGLVVAAASGIGGGLASVISPAKLQNAAASIDRIGEEASVLRTTFVVSLVITTVAAIMTLLMAY